MESIVEIPEFIKNLLQSTGFDSLSQLMLITEEAIHDIETYVQLNKDEVINDFSGKYSETYKQQTTFKLLPAHRNLLRRLPKYTEELIESRAKSKINFNDECFSVILRELIKTAYNNAEKDKNHQVYSDEIRYFCTYIYLLCGKQCYETLYRNLPIPSTKTVSKLTFNA